MVNKMNNINDTQSLRIAQDLKKHNWLLNKFRDRRDISITENIRPRVPVSLPLNLLPKNTTTATMDLNKKSAIPPQKKEILSQNDLWKSNNANPRIAFETIEQQSIKQQSIKHNLPIPALPNRDRYLVSRSETVDVKNNIQRNKIQKLNVATQTNKVNILSDEEYRFYEKSKQGTSVDLINNLPNMEKNQMDVATCDNRQESQEITNNVVIDEQSMSEIQSTSDEYKKFISIFLSTMNEAKENVLVTNLEKRETFFKMLEILLKTFCDKKDKPVEHTRECNAITNNPAGMQIQNMQEQLQLRQQLIQTVMQQANTSQQIAQNNQVDYTNNNIRESNNHQQILTQTSLNNSNSTNYPSNDQTVREIYYPFQNREEHNGQYDSQRYNYMQMVQRSRAPAATMVRHDNNTAIPRASYRYSREGWPYPRQAVMDSMQSQEMNHHRRQLHTTQYAHLKQYDQNHQVQAYYPQEALQHQQPNHNQQMPMQQQIMYNNIFA